MTLTGWSSQVSPVNSFVFVLTKFHPEHTHARIHAVLRFGLDLTHHNCLGVTLEQKTQLRACFQSHCAELDVLQQTLRGDFLLFEFYHKQACSSKCNVIKPPKHERQLPPVHTDYAKLSCLLQRCKLQTLSMQVHPTSILCNVTDLSDDPWAFTIFCNW